MASISTTKALAIKSIDETQYQMLMYPVLIAFGVALIAISAKIQVPFWPVPATLQTLAIMGLAAAYGLRLGLATIIAYLAAGYFGLPVFAGLLAGPAYFVGPTAGYLAGFVAATAIVGYVADRCSSSNIIALGAATLAGSVVIYLLGAYWLGFVFIGSSGKIMGAELAWKFGVAPFIIADVVKAILAAIIVPALSSLMNK